MMGVRSVECRVRSIGWIVATTALMLAAMPSLADRKAEIDWRSDPLMIANVTVSGRTLTLEQVCRQLSRQTSAQFYVDRRYAGASVTLHIRSAKLETVMTCVEEITRLQWRLVDDMFFLTSNARGTAVVRWNERYQEARKTQLAKTTENRLQEWLYETMPFPPSFDAEWELTPLQREQIAYGNALSIFTMTPPQIGWLNYALRAKGFRTTDDAPPTDLLVREAPDLTARLNAVMIIDSPQGTLIVEKPLSAPEPRTADARPVKPVKTTDVAVDPQEPPKETALGGRLSGIWITDEKPTALSRLLRAAKARGFHDVFVPVLSRGQAIYPSKVLQPGVDRPVGEDRLSVIVETADRLGMRVHAVLDATLWGDATHPAPQPARYVAAQDRNLLDRTYSEQAQWQQGELAAMEADTDARNLPQADKSVYLCPASSQTARLLKAVAKEIASNYKVAGVCIDRLEYPRSAPFVVNGRDMTPPFGYTIEVRKEMIRAHQIDPIDIDPEGVRSPADLEAQALWDKFRRGKLTGLIAEVSATLKAINPDAVCSVTLDPESDAQSPGHWSQVDGVDALLPTVRSDTEEESDVQTVNALYAAVSKYAAVVPVLHGGEGEGLADLVASIGAQEHDKGWILRGSMTELTKALEGLPADSGK